MYLIAPFFPQIEYFSPKTIHCCVQQNLNQYHFVSKKYLETFKGVVTNKNNFTKTSIFSEKIFRKL